MEGRLTEQWRKNNLPEETGQELLEGILVERRRRWEEEQLASYEAKGKKPLEGWRERYEEPVGPDASGLPKLSDGWCWAALPQLGELGRGKSKHRPRGDAILYGGEFPFIQTGEVTAADGWIRTYSQTYNERGLSQSRLWPAGTLCITIAANIAETGILAFPACFPDSVVGLVTGQPMLTRFVELFVRTAKSDLERYAPATAQKNINLSTLSQLAVPLPPSAELQKIVSLVDEVLAVAENAEAASARGEALSSALRQSILKRAFEGGLVPQDPDEEPASVLLERIRTEREAHGNTKKKRSRKKKSDQPAAYA